MDATKINSITLNVKGQNVKITDSNNNGVFDSADTISILAKQIKLPGQKNITSPNNDSNSIFIEDVRKQLPNVGNKTLSNTAPDNTKNKKPWFLEDIKPQAPKANDKNYKTTYQDTEFRVQAYKKAQKEQEMAKIKANVEASDHVKKFTPDQLATKSAAERAKSKPLITNNKTPKASTTPTAVKPIKIAPPTPSKVEETPKVIFEAPTAPDVPQSIESKFLSNPIISEKAVQIVKETIAEEASSIKEAEEVVNKTSALTRSDIQTKTVSAVETESIDDLYNAQALIKADIEVGNPGTIFALNQELEIINAKILIKESEIAVKKPEA